MGKMPFRMIEEFEVTLIVSIDYSTEDRRISCESKSCLLTFGFRFVVLSKQYQYFGCGLARKKCLDGFFRDSRNSVPILVDFHAAGHITPRRVTESFQLEARGENFVRAKRQLHS